jgi:bacillithiol biosynthesis cysteine-adding enzyme BshC
MPTINLPYAETGYYSPLIIDYLQQKKSLLPFYHRFPDRDSFKQQIEEKQATFTTASRTLLVDRLKAQYTAFKPTQATLDNIDALLEEGTFTITTGHQLNLFTGPLYFVYKILHVINLSEALNKRFPENRLVPVFWMATEDHDFEEINFFNVKGQKVRWTSDHGGAVGRYPLEGMDQVLEQFEAVLGKSDRARQLLELFEKAYLDHRTLADATRYLVNELFGRFGLVVIDGDDPHLKRSFAGVVKHELTDHKAYSEIERTTRALEQAGYPKQVHPREINLFYLTPNGRHRIIREGDRFYINDTDLTFTPGELMNQLTGEPGRFSPNALLRPLYQELVLPNLCYIGGGGELAYWFQLKDCFASFDVSFPLLLLRNSVLVMSDKQQQKLEKLGRNVSELFLPKNEMEDRHVRDLSKIVIDFDPQRRYLKEQFAGLYDIARQTDKSFLGAVAAQEKKQLNGLNKLEKRLLKAQKRKLADQLDRLIAIQSELFPGGSLQERHDNLAGLYLEYGPELFDKLRAQLDPLSREFAVLCW